MFLLNRYCGRLGYRKIFRMTKNGLRGRGVMYGFSQLGGSHSRLVLPIGKLDLNEQEQELRPYGKRFDRFIAEKLTSKPFEFKVESVREAMNKHFDILPHSFILVYDPSFKMWKIIPGKDNSNRCLFLFDFKKRAGGYWYSISGKVETSFKKKKVRLFNVELVNNYHGGDGGSSWPGDYATYTLESWFSGAALFEPGGFLEITLDFDYQIGGDDRKKGKNVGLCTWTGEELVHKEEFEDIVSPTKQVSSVS